MNARSYNAADSEIVKDANVLARLLSTYHSTVPRSGLGRDETGALPRSSGTPEIDLDTKDEGKRKRPREGEGEGEVHFLWKNPDFLLKNDDFQLKNHDFLLKQHAFDSKKGRGWAGPAGAEEDTKRRPPAYFTLNGRFFATFSPKNRCILTGSC